MSWPRGAGAEAEAPSLERARAMIERQEYAQARRALQGLLESGGMQRDQLVETYRHLAECAAALRDPDAAREAFVLLLAMDPAFYVPTEESPLVRGPFEQARAFWETHQRPGLSFTPPVGPPPPGPAVVQADVRRGDRPALAHAATLHVRRSDGTYRDVEAPEGRAEIPPEDLEGADELSLYFTLHDEWGNTTAEAGSAASPLIIALREEADEPDARQPRRWYRQWWFWSIVGAAVVGLAVGLPVGLATSDEEGGCTEALGASCDFELHPEL
jgi:hypothetical protein